MNTRVRTSRPRHHRPAANLLVLLLTAAAIVMPTHAQDADQNLSPERKQEILDESITAYDDAVTIARSDATRAAELYRTAAAGFKSLTDAGIRNAPLEYNRGNVHFRLREYGKAILHYRRAEQLDPSNPRLAANLRYARNQVEPVIEPSGQRELTRRLLFWHYDTTTGHRLVAFGALSALGWGMLFAWLWWRRRVLAILGTITVIIAVMAGSSLYWEIQTETQHPEAVLVGQKEYLRLGRGEGADLALKQPLGPGVEVRILQTRGGWVEIRLANDQTGWLPRTAIERI